MVMEMDSASRLALHPRRKRKFFADLAQLLDEDPPEIRPLQSAFFGPELPEGAAYSAVDAAERDTPSGASATQTQLVTSHSLTGDSFDSVEFGAPRTRSNGISSCGASQQSSLHNDSMADSLLFLPNAMSSSSLNASSNSQKRQQLHVRFEFDVETKRASLEAKGESLPVTTLINTGMISKKLPTTVRLELADYYDNDRMCELSPCWLRNDGASCEMHQGAIRRPMLLFCLQALDEFIAWNEWQGQQRWRVQACKLARRVFTAMWETDVLGAAVSDRDIVLMDCVAKKTAEVGVALDVWCIIARYWDKYKQNYLHQQELYFTDAHEGGSTQAASKWDQVRGLLHIYGMKLSQASRLVEQQGADQLDACALTSKQLRTGTHGLPSTNQLRVGMEYLGCEHDDLPGKTEDAASVAQRLMISQQDGKTAFNAILIHLKKWNQDVQVFPCGSFSRGAAFISVLDVLVAVPSESDLSSADPGADEKHFQDVVTALVAAKVIQKDVMRQLTRTRGACTVPFKSRSILLDLKVYSPPRSWFALLYFTGPEDFVVTFFTDLLKRSLREIADTSFECIYATVAEGLGQDAVFSVGSEKDLFDLLDRGYLQPTDRI
ncbi:hypothetical protein PRIC1_000770 [Phytophthora ramorum]